MVSFGSYAPVLPGAICEFGNWPERISTSNRRVFRLSAGDQPQSSMGLFQQHRPIRDILRLSHHCFSTWTSVCATCSVSPPNFPPITFVKLTKVAALHGNFL